MSDNEIRVDDVNFPRRIGTPQKYQGIHSGRSLASISLDFTESSPEAIALIENLLGKSEVDVTDPFAGHSYRASIQLRSESYQVGYPERHFVVDVREIDVPPHFTMLEVNGSEYHVLDYRETVQDDQVDGRCVLFHLQEVELASLRATVREEQILFRRVGVDDKAIPLRWGGDPQWSQHNEGGEAYYKQRIWFYPVDHEPSLGLNLASGVVQDALLLLTRTMDARLRALIDELHQTGTLSPEARVRLIESDWKDLISPEYVEQLRWCFWKVDDAATGI